MTYYYMNPLHAIILGIIEGLTEFLPISSTAHLLVANRLLGLEMTDFVKSFDIFIQLGAILAVVVLYAKKLLTDRKTFLRVLTAFIPTAVIGFALYPLVKAVLLDNLFIVAIALILGGIGIVIFERWQRRRNSELRSAVSPSNALSIGLFQSLALIPGVSRAGATILGGLALGLDRAAIVEFSFLLAIPTMAAAVGLDLVRSDMAFTSSQWLILGVGFVSAFITALVAVTSLLRFIRTRDFSAFGWYRIVIGGAILLFLL